MARNFSRAFGDFDIEACEEYYDAVENKDTRWHRQQRINRDIATRRRNPQEKNRERQQAREIKNTRLNYFR